jgi:PelA/Pel-15E family pectate lyase
MSVFTLRSFTRPARLRVVFLLLFVVPASLFAALPRWPDVLGQPDAYYASPEARSLAGSVMAHQTPSGGWPKNTDFTNPPTGKASGKPREATIDNKGTTLPLTFLAHVISASPSDKAALSSFLRGFDYLLAAQYENGGWPQFFPLRKGYYSAITYNDDAMINVLVLLKAAAAKEAPFTFLDDGRRARAVAAVTRGIECILKTQVRQNAALTAWCAQHDPQTLAPCWARNYEPPSLSGSESVGIVRFLMSVENPSPAIIAAVEGAVAWFEKTKITGQRFEYFTDAGGEKDRHITPDPSAPPLWARFYELETDRPLFLGRDRVFHYSLTEIERERRTGYAFYTTRAASLLAKDYPRWRTRIATPKP